MDTHSASATQASTPARTIPMQALSIHLFDPDSASARSAVERAGAVRWRPCSEWLGGAVHGKRRLGAGGNGERWHPGGKTGKLDLPEEAARARGVVSLLIKAPVSH